MNGPEQPGYDASVVWAGRPAWGEYAFLWFVAAVFAVRVAVSLGLGYWTSALFHLAAVGILSGLAVFFRLTTRYRVTREAVYRTKGIRGTAEHRIPLETIETTDELQGPVDRMLGIGTVVIHLKGGVRERISGVSDPEVVSRKIRALL